MTIYAGWTVLRPGTCAYTIASLQAPEIAVQIDRFIMGKLFMEHSSQGPKSGTLRYLQPLNPADIAR